MGINHRCPHNNNDNDSRKQQQQQQQQQRQTISRFASLTMAAAAPPSLDEINGLMTQQYSAYSADSIPALEVYTEAVATGQATPSMEANRRLLKLYQFYPSLRQSDVVARILLLAMAEYPSTDLLSLLYMIPEKVQSEDVIRTIIR